MDNSTNADSDILRYPVQTTIHNVLDTSLCHMGVFFKRKKSCLMNPYVDSYVVANASHQHLSRMWLVAEIMAVCLL